MKQVWLCHLIYPKVNIADRNLSEAGKHKSQFKVSSVFRSASILLKLIFFTVSCFLGAQQHRQKNNYESPTDPLGKKVKFK